MSVLTDLIQDPSGTGLPATYTLTGLTTKAGHTDPNGALVEEIPKGRYLFARTAGGLTNIDSILVPDTGLWNISELIGADPTAAVVLYGVPGTFTVPVAGELTTSNHTISSYGPPSWTFHPGKTIGWAYVASDGTVFFCGQDLGLSSYLPTGTEFLVSTWSPTGEVLNHIVIPTSTGDERVVGLNGVVGGAYAADVAPGAVILGSEYMYVLTSHPYGPSYNDWQISVHGEYPMFAGFHQVGGQWTYDVSKSWTPKQINALSANGALAFPLATNSFGESYGNDLATNELRVLPASKMIVCPQYFNAPGATTFGGSVFTLDPASGIVTGYYPIPFPSGVSPGHANPRGIFVNPTGTLGNEVFGVMFDMLGSPFNVTALFTYDHGAGTITQLTNFLQSPAGMTAWDHAEFDDEGWLLVASGNGLFSGPVHVFPKADGSWKFARYPYAYDGSNSVMLCSADHIVTTDATGFSNNRILHDAATKCTFIMGASVKVAIIRKDGDAHSPSLSLLPTILTDVQTYTGTQPGTNWPMAAAIDTVARKIYWGLGRLNNSATAPSYPPKPGNLPTYMLELRVDQIAQTPLFVGQTTGGVAANANLATVLPTEAITGDAVAVVITANLTSADANITPPAGWTRELEASNGTFGRRYAVFYRVLQAGDTNPTFVMPRAAGAVWSVVAYRGAHATTPINASAITLSSGAIGLVGSYEMVAPGVTSSVNGCRVLDIFCANAVQSWTWAQGAKEVRRSERDGVLGGGSSVLVAEQLDVQAAAGATQPTTWRMAVLGLNATISLAIAPAAAPSAPKAVTSVACVPNPVAHGSTTTATVTLATAVDRDTAVTMTASNGKATVPGTCVVLAGATTGVVTVNALTAGTCTISAYSGSGSTQNTVLTIT